jgi:hypothetical protein
MRRIRTSVEWPYETATNLFHILQSKHLKRLLKNIVCKHLRVFLSFITAMFALMVENLLVSLT